MTPSDVKTRPIVSTVTLSSYEGLTTVLNSNTGSWKMPSTIYLKAAFSRIKRHKSYIAARRGCYGAAGSRVQHF